MGLSQSSCSHGCQDWSPCISTDPPDLKCIVNPDDGDILAPKVVVDGLEFAQGNSQPTCSQTPALDTNMGVQEDFRRNPPSEVTESLATETFMVKLDMSDPSEKMGIVVDFSNDYSMIVKSINPGLIQRWNLQNPDREVREKDHIVEVNGTRGNAEQLVDACRKQAQLQLMVDRFSTSMVTSNGMTLPVEQCLK